MFQSFLNKFRNSKKSSKTIFLVSYEANNSNDTPEQAGHEQLKIKVCVEGCGKEKYVGSKVSAEGGGDGGDEGGVEVELLRSSGFGD